MSASTLWVHLLCVCMCLSLRTRLRISGSLPHNSSHVNAIILATTHSDAILQVLWCHSDSFYIVLSQRVHRCIKPSMVKVQVKQMSCYATSHGSKHWMLLYLHHSWLRSCARTEKSSSSKSRMKICKGNILPTSVELNPVEDNILMNKDCIRLYNLNKLFKLLT